jgi:pimeloyl-ACP methyl ester carboxylesterase
MAVIKMIIDKVKANKTAIEYFCFGNGEKPLIILPGIGFQRIALSANAVSSSYKIFSDDYKIYVFDRRDDLDGDSGIEQFADDTAAAMDALGIEVARSEVA